MLESVNYTIGAHDLLHHPETPQRLRLMREAGLTHVWLTGYYFGRHESDPEELYRARKLVLEEGFQTGVLSLPVGHPGNSLNPDDPTLDLAIARTWRYRVNSRGEKAYFSACVEDTMLRDNAAAAKEYAQMGFTQHFFDDDLRMANLGDPYPGCFCDHCIAEFNRRVNASFTREQLADAYSADPDTHTAWDDYNCSKITRFMEETAVPGMRNGIMVMYTGGRAHGIDIPAIREAVPDCLFRVGEWHFNDQTYGAPGAKERLAQSIRDHMALIGSNPAYSESTVFPAAALTPEHLLDKIRLEISLGLRNIFLMGGSWFISEPYWKLLKQEKEHLQELAE